MKKIKQIIRDIFIWEPNVIKNLEEYEQKEKAKQQESKVLGQKLVKGKTNKEESTI